MMICIATLKMHLNNSKLGPSLERNIPSVIDSNEISVKAKTFVPHVWNTLGRNIWRMIQLLVKMKFRTNVPSKLSSLTLSGCKTTLEAEGYQACARH
jgi:hypothetical protein